VDVTENGVDNSQGRAVVHETSRWCVPRTASPGITNRVLGSLDAELVTVSTSWSSKNTLTFAQCDVNVGSRRVMAIPGGPDDGVDRNDETTFNERSAFADGLPLLLTVWPVKVCDVDVPSAPTAVTDAVYEPALAYTCVVVAVVVDAVVPSPKFQS
jgi:hypothetical protein